jgi:hypothetical protein
MIGDGAGNCCLANKEAMRCLAPACDYDGTLAHDGVLDEATAAALDRFRASGRRLLIKDFFQRSIFGKTRPAQLES